MLKRIGGFTGIMVYNVNMQPIINGKITQLANKPEELKEFMKDKTDKQKELGRSHLRTVRGLRK